MAHKPTEDQIWFAHYLGDIYDDDRWGQEMTFEEFLGDQLDNLDVPYEEVMLQGFDTRDEAKDAMTKLCLEIYNG